MRYPDFAPVILAAGASSRMGRPKELLEFGGVTALELALQRCEQSGSGAPIVVTRIEREAQIRALITRSTSLAKVVVNPSPELGQTSSLRIGIAQLTAETRAFLIYPVDFTLVRAEDIARLCATFAMSNPAEQYSSTEPSNRPEPQAGRADLVAPSFARRRGHPVVVSVRLAPALLALPPDASARLVLSAPEVRVEHVEFEDDRVLQDMDTPEAYARCLARHRT